MKQIIYLLIVIFTIACADEKSNHQKDEVDNLIKQTEAIDLDTTQLYSEQQIVSKSFLDLVKFIDTSGFICDSVRFQKTYRRVNQQRKIKIKDYLFYELNLEETVPILENYSVVENRIDSKAKSNDTLALKQTQEWKKRWQINKHLFEKATKITAYFYVEKSLYNRNGGQTHQDGIIEEWKFPDAQSAKEAAEDLSKKESKVYVNRGAYVCYLNQYLYVFHARSAGFYTPLKKFMLHLVAQNNATIPK